MMVRLKMGLRLRQRLRGRLVRVEGEIDVRNEANLGRNIEMQAEVAVSADVQCETDADADAKSEVESEIEVEAEVEAVRGWRHTTIGFGFCAASGGGLADAGAKSASYNERVKPSTWAP